MQPLLRANLKQMPSAMLDQGKSSTGRGNLSEATGVKATMRQPAIVLAIAGLAAVGLATAPVVASASCAAPPTLAHTIADAQTVFAGTVTGLQGGSRVATVHVDDVWKGKDVAAVVEVVGTPELSAAATSVDRTYATGQQYLFIPTSGSVAQFQDNNCTLTQTYSPSLSGLRPANAPGTPKRPASLDFPILPVVAGLATITVVVGMAALALYLRRRASSLLREV